MTDKATWWSVTAFNQEIDLLEKGEFPSYVKAVYGGREECPDTKRLHFQGAVQLRSQQRLSTLKKWLPTAHFEVARNKDAIKKYAMKEETAVGPKTEKINDIEHITVEKIMLKMADEWDSDVYSEYLEEFKDDVKEAFKSAYWHTVRSILRKYPDYRKVCNIFARADVVTLWDRTRTVWLAVATESNSITLSASGPEIISNEIVQNAHDEEEAVSPQT